MKLAAVERAIASFRTGRSVRIGAASYAPVETTSQAMLDLIAPPGNARLILSGSRAAALSLGNDINAADPGAPVALAQPSWLDAAAALADPGQDLVRAPAGPLQAVALADPSEAQAALKLTRMAGLLPALWMVDARKADLTIAPHDILTATTEVSIVARARLPIHDLPDAQIAVFRAADDGEEHVALVIGAFGGDPPLVRLHSECLTGDVFCSLKCDCGPQLKEALRLIGDAGGGILLYLRQEGRGIGIANKIRAYALQDRGLDTVDANARLGFADDERGYEHAAGMLRALGADRIRLLTNNPAKVSGLERSGIAVVERVAHHMPVNPHNADYLAVKRRKSGHLA